MMRRFSIALLLCGCVTVPKTAIVDGKEVPRLDLQFDGQPYALRHEGAHPQPGGASSGLNSAGGAIRGRVCGMLVDFDVTHKGDHVQLVGSIDNHIPAAIDVSEQGGIRHFTGNLGNLGVDFLLAPDGMQGHVGVRVFAVDADRGRDVYAGYMRVSGTLDVNGSKQRASMLIRGRDALWAMPPADEAAALPAIITCDGMQYRFSTIFDVGFGGATTDRPPETSSVYTHGR